MRRPATDIGVASAVLALLCLVPAPAHPTNGLNMIGFGAESVAMERIDRGPHHAEPPMVTVRRTKE